MQIYVVKRGDSLYNIAKAFNSSVAEIVTANEIPNPDRLAVGQALVIPITGSYYYVMPGDSLYSIGRKFGINYLTLAKINGLNPERPLMIGQRLYIPPEAKTSIETNAYIEPPSGGAGENLIKDLNRAAPYLTYLAPFSYTLNPDGSLNPPNLTGITAPAKEQGATLMMAVTNIRNGRFDGELGRAVLSDKAVQAKLLDNIIAEAKKQGGFSDVHFDFEYLPGDLKDEYTAFLQYASGRLHSEGYQISAALAPKYRPDQPGQWYAAHDYGAIGKIVDFVVIMTYEWGYSGGPPMPVSPLNEVRKVLNYALTVIPAEKILMGQNLYGYDWQLPFVPDSGRSARALSPQSAIQTAIGNNAEIRYDTNAAAPFILYTDKTGVRHIIWFEDARSIQAKFNLIKELGLRGISYWRLGLPFPQNWLLLNSNFNIVKK